MPFPIITAFLVATFVHADLTIDVARSRDGQSVLNPDVDLHGLLHGMVPLLVPDVFSQVGCIYV